MAGALVGLGMLGLVARNVMLGWFEARAKMRESTASLNPIASAMAITWDRNQIERALSLLESISESLELLAQVSKAMAQNQSDQFQQTTKSKLDDILRRLEDVEWVPPNVRR